MNYIPIQFYYCNPYSIQVYYYRQLENSLLLQSNHVNKQGLASSLRESILRFQRNQQNQVFSSQIQAIPPQIEVIPMRNQVIPPQNEAIARRNEALPPQSEAIFTSNDTNMQQNQVLDQMDQKQKPKTVEKYKFIEYEKILRSKRVTYRQRYTEFGKERRIYHVPRKIKVEQIVSNTCAAHIKKQPNQKPLSQVGKKPKPKEQIQLSNIDQDDSAYFAQQYMTLSQIRMRRENLQQRKVECWIQQRKKTRSGIVSVRRH